MRPSRHFPTPTALLVFALLILQAAPSGAITRDRVMARAKAFAFHPWRCTSANQTAGCSPSYTSPFPVGDYLGLPYDWGGCMSLFEFDQQIAAGYGAGSVPYGDILDCTAGLDCSGYVSQCWDTGYHTTDMIPDISTEIPAAGVLPGDVFNDAGHHVVLYGATLPDGQPVLYESNGLVHMNVYGGWSHVAGYVPRRYDGIEGSTAGDPAGTVTNPIVIGSFPFTDSRDTSDSASDAYDGCGAAPTTDESGPEFIYEATFTQPGSLTVTVEDGPGVDIDVHLLTSGNTGDCVVRNDLAFTYGVDCGAYLIIADTYVSYEGPYTLTVTFTPSGGGCGSGPAGYDPLGGPADPCAYPGHEDLPMCNPNTGVYTCLYSDVTPTFSFCSRACAGPSDCADFPGGCCADIGGGETYCLTASFCGIPPVDGEDVPDTAADPELVIVPDAEEGQDDPVDDGSFPDAVQDTAADTPPQDDASGDDGTPQEDGPAWDGPLPPDDGGEKGCGCSMVR